MPGTSFMIRSVRLLERPLARGELAAVAAEPALVAGQRDDQQPTWR